jgi:hypothetical protein
MARTTQEPWTEHDVEHELLNAVLAGTEGAELPVARARTFEEAGVLTQNAGLVVGLEDGTEFQLTIVRSR